MPCWARSSRWFVGWSLILEYSLVVSTVAVGWSGYAVGFLKGLGIILPDWMTHGPTLVTEGGMHLDQCRDQRAGDPDHRGGGRAC